MSILFAICVILMCLFLYFGWVEQNVGHKKAANVYYSIGSVSMVIVVIIVAVALA